MIIIKAIKNPAGGVAVAPALLYRETDDAFFSKENRTDLPPEREPEASEEDDLCEQGWAQRMAVFFHARDAVMAELGELGKKHSIFLGQREIAGDPVLEEKIGERMKKKGALLPEVLWKVIEETALEFLSLPDPYIKERANDIRDVGKRLLAKLSGIEAPDFGYIKKECILIARRIPPSAMLTIDTAYIKGIICEEGTYTGHEAILSGSLQIPFLAGAASATEKLREGMLLCMDAKKGIILGDPDEKSLYAFRQEQIDLSRQAETETGHGFLAGKRLLSKAGREIQICANAGSLLEVSKARAQGIRRIGLFRTEFFFMQGDRFPTEEEQFAVYSEAAGRMEEVTIRLLDIGGDKGLPYFPMEKEDNPFLGWRGIRILLDKPEILKIQLRAILRAGVYGRLRILVPMVADTKELGQVKAVLEECKEALEKEKAAFEKNIPLGIMAETPSSVFLAGELAREADFFSIGTNDLTQYILAAERGNRRVSDRYAPLHPAVQRAVVLVLEEAVKKGIPVSVCGEMAADPAGAAWLLSAGISILSMSLSSHASVIGHLLEQGLCTLKE